LVPAVGVALLVSAVVAGTPVLVAWVVLALAAGYAISGSA
jgi:hypothetical protein